jgi:hypothetical protein
MWQLVRRTGWKRSAGRAVAPLAMVLVLGITMDAPAQERSEERLRREEQLVRCSAAIGCTPFSYAVSLAWAKGWRPGSYELTISVDGTTRRCTVTAPDAVCSDSAGLQRHRQVAECDLDPFGYVELVDAVRIPADWPPQPSMATIPEQEQLDRKLGQLAGCALPGTHAPLGSIIFWTRLNSVNVSVSQGGRVVGTGDYHPVYQMWKPLGPDCDFACARAEGDALAIEP